MELKNLPIGNQDFKVIVTENRFYLDKTEKIFSMVAGSDWQKYNFFSRPRRFGKSLTCSTIKYLFEGEKELFKGLWIYDKWDWNKKFPVIHLSYDSIYDKQKGLEESLVSYLIKQAQHYKIKLNEKTSSSLFVELITELQLKLNNRVVIIIDEYDKPITDYVTVDGGINQAKENQHILREFYRTLKSLDSALRFVFITGVSKFTNTGVFSNLNNLNYLTDNPAYYDLVGFTQKNLEIDLKPYFEKVFLTNFATILYEDFLNLIKKWYNGYSWDGENFIYNPFSILKFILNKEFKNYWFETGVPKFFVSQMMDKADFNLQQIQEPNSIIDGYDISTLDERTMMFQTGFLSVKKKIQVNQETLYVLDYANFEIERSMHDLLFNNICQNNNFSSTIQLTSQIHRFFEDNKIEEVINVVQSIIASIPNPIFAKANESLFHCIVHIIFKLNTKEVISEVNTNLGRIDCVVQTKTHIYIFEFKINKTATEALQQIKDNKYAEKYVIENKKIILIGVNFSSKDKNIIGYELDNYN